MAVAHPIGLSEPEPPPSGDGRVTPMMEQYIEIKAANPDCLLFYRMGDFYEMFFDDAETASRALGIMLTKRGKHMGADIPMCGVPVERAAEYLHRLIALGHRVAVCEQLEDRAEARKRGPKSVVRRGVRDLRRAHADRPPPAAVAALARERRRHHGDRPGHPRQSRIDAHVGGRAARLTAGVDRPQRDLGRLAAVGAAIISAALPPTCASIR